MSAAASDAPPPRRLRAFALTVLSSQVHSFLTLLLGFVTTPLLLHHLGAERFGLWRVLEVWLAYLALLPQTVAQGVAFLLVPLLAAGDGAGLRRLAATAWAVGTSVSAAGALAGLGLVPLLPWLLAAPPELAEERRLAFLIAVLGSVPLAPLLLVRSFLEADQKGYLVNVAVSLHAVTFAATAVGLAVSGHGLPGQAAAMLAAGTVQAAVLAVWAWRHYPWARPGWPGRAETAALLGRVAALLLLAVFSGVAARVEYVLVNEYAGAAATARYSVGQRLFVVYGGLVAAFGNSIWAPLTDLFHRQEEERFRRQLERAVRVVAVLGAAGAVAIVAANAAFVRLWVGLGYEPDGRMQAAFAVTYPLLGVNILVTWLLTATGQHRLMLLSTATYCAATLLAGSVGGRWGGPAGVAWGTTAGIAAAVAVNLVAACAIYRLAAGALAWRLLLTAILAVAFSGAWAELVAGLDPQGWVGVLAVLATGWAGFGLLAGAVCLDGGDRAELVRLVRTVAGWRTPPRG